jgi:cyclopropane fatty-acyl-phospholipid synthase-like methyltransferase
MLDCLVNGAEKVYGFEIDQRLISWAKRCFQKLDIPESRYEFIDLTQPLPDLPRADIIYCIAMFMHLPFWQACRYFRWIHDILAPDGEAHLQFYQKPGKNWTMFWRGVPGSDDDSVATVRLHHELERAGFKILDKHLAEGEGVLPLWQMYRLGKL